MKERLMVIGSGWQQVPLIETAKKMGCFVLALDSNPNADGFKLADASEVVDSRDIRNAIHFFEKYKINAVVSDNDDYGLYTSGIVARKFGVPGPSLTAVTYSNNKRASRTTCQAAGIKQPPFHPCRTFEDLLDGATYVGGYPIIVKPVDNRGNFGVNKVDNETELEIAFLDALSNAHSREFIVEKFIEGTLMTVDGFSFSKDFHVSLGVASKVMLGGHRRVAMHIIYPGNFDRDIIQRALENNNSVTKALGYNFGHTHSEYIVDEHGEIWLIESTNRGGGVFTSSLIVPAITELDLNKYFVSLALGVESIPTNIDPLNPMKNCALLTFFKFPKGKIKKIHGLDKARALQGILTCALLVKEGDIIEDITTDADRHGYAVIVARNKEDLLEKEKKIKQLVVLDYE